MQRANRRPQMVLQALLTQFLTYDRLASQATRFLIDLDDLQETLEDHQPNVALLHQLRQFRPFVAQFEDFCIQARNAVEQQLQTLLDGHVAEAT